MREKSPVNIGEDDLNVFSSFFVHILIIKNNRIPRMGVRDMIVGQILYALPRV